MGSRLLPLALVTAALVCDGLGLHGIASLLVLAAVIGAAAAAFVGVADVMEGKDAWLRAIGATAALALLLIGAAVRSHAASGAAVPTVAISALVAVLAVYSLPALGWLLEPLAPRRVEPVRVREEHGRADSRTAEAA